MSYTCIYIYGHTFKRNNKMVNYLIRMLLTVTHIPLLLVAHTVQSVSVGRNIMELGFN